MSIRTIRQWTARDGNLALALVAGALFIVGTVTLIPWSDLPTGAARANSVFTSSQLHALRSYASEQRHIGWSAYFLNLALAIALAAIPVVRRAFNRIRGPLVVRIVLASGVVCLLSALVSLPFDWLAFQKARDVGVSVESTGLWWRDLIVSTVVAWVPFALAAVVIVLLVRRLPRAWPLVLSLLAGLVVVIGSLIFPVVISPLFTSTHPLPPGPLRSEIFALAKTEGVHLRDVVVADASTRTTAENAEVTGFGPTEELVLDDTLLRSMTQPEIAVVVGHELGHAAHHDVLTGTVLGALGAVAGAGLAGFVVVWRGKALHFTQASAVPLLFALMAVGAFVISPLENSMSRAIESRADRASLAATHDPQAFIRAQTQLDLAAKVDPTPPAWSQFWWGSHPTVLQRISLAR